MSVVPRPLVMKIDARPPRLDLAGERLIEAGFQLVKAASIKEGIRLARRCNPHLIVTVDNPRRGFDAVQWLEQQHSDTSVALAMTPLVVLADEYRVDRLAIHELPDRVRILTQPVNPEQLLAEVRQILSVWRF
ncbi:MAG: hypothetical protein GYB66_04815 [Chloroflexi bacterium]|nr:hypothetical protein [Chloroflexota bacterium]